MNLDELVADLGQDALALAAGVSSRTVRNWTTGRTSPRGLVRERLEVLSRVVDEVGPGEAKAWLTTPSNVLGGQRPAEVLAKEGLTRHVRAAMGERATRSSLAAQRRPGASPRGHLDLHSLGADRFEDLCIEILEAHPDFDDVNGYGQSGSRQRGADIFARDRNGALVLFQCKCIASATADTVRKVVAANDHEVARSVLLVAGDARTSARDEVQARPAWQMWDRSEITRVIRSLPAVKGRRILDFYFDEGVRRRVLGAQGTETFLTGEELHARALDPRATYNLTHALIGRDSELARAITHLRRSGRGAVVVTGHNGVGTTRFLLEVDRDLQRETDRPVIWLAAGAALTPTLLDDLPSESLTLVVDDADRRSDLPELLAAVGRRRFPTSLVLGCHRDCRPALVLAGWESDDIEDIVLPPLSASSLDGLIRALGVTDDDGDVLLRASDGRPLLLTVGASVMRRHEVTAGSAMGSRELRDHILSRWADEEIERAIGGPSAVARRLLASVAALSPMRVDGPRARGWLATMLAEPQWRIDERIAGAVSAGLLIERQGAIRISPPALGDLLLVAAVTGGGSGHSNFLRDLSDATAGADDQLVASVRNVAEAMWRWERRGASISPLDAVWRLVETKFDAAGAEGRAQIVGSLADLGLREPRRFFALVDRAMGGTAEPEPTAFGRMVIDQSDVLAACVAGLRLACYRSDAIDDALDRLWAISGRDRTSSMGRKGALDVLTEAASFAPGKPIAMQRRVLAKVEEWLGSGRAINAGGVSALRVLRPLVAKSGTEFRARRNTFEMSTFEVSPRIADDLYEATLDLALRHMTTDDAGLAGDAVSIIASAVRGPTGYFGNDPSAELVAEWEGPRRRVLEALTRRVADVPSWLAPHVRDAVGWIGRHDDGLGDAARRVIAALPDDIDARLAYVLAGGPSRWRDRPRSPDWEEAEAKDQRFADEVATELLGSGVRSATGRVATCIARVKSAGGDPWAAGVMVAALARGLTGELVDLALSCAEHPALAPFVRWVILEELRRDHGAGVELASQLLDVGNREVQASVAHLWSYAPWIEDVDLESATAVLRRLLDIGDSVIRKSAVEGIGPLLEVEPRVAVSVLADLRISGDQLVAGAVCSVLHDRRRRGRPMPDDIDAAMLEQLAEVPSLSEYPIVTWLAAIAPHDLPAVAALLIRRIEERSARPGRFGTAVPVDLGFGELGAIEQHPEHRAWLVRARDLALVDDWTTRDWAPELFNVLSDPNEVEGPRPEASSRPQEDDDEVLRYGYGPVAREVLAEMAAERTEEALSAVGELLSEAPDRFFFDHANWVVGVLREATAVSPVTADRFTAALAATISSGDISGPVGEAPPRLVKALRRAREVLAGIDDPVGHRAYSRLVELLDKDVERHIEWDRERRDHLF